MLKFVWMKEGRDLQNEKIYTQYCAHHTCSNCRIVDICSKLGEFMNGE